MSSMEPLLEAPVAVSEDVPAQENHAVGDIGRKLHHKNYLNLLAFIANTLLVYGVGKGGWSGTPTFGEMSNKYQTLVTPNPSAFAIRTVIFVAQGTFAVLQLLPRIRGHAMIHKGISYWYSVAAAMRIGWIFAFVYDAIIASVAFVFLVWVSLIAILYSQYYTESDGTLLEFWVLRFPFAIHAGWTALAAAAYVNILVVSIDESATVQLAVAIVSLAILYAVSVWVLFNIPRPNWTVACVLSWSFGWIYAELENPMARITDTFDEDTIGGVKYAAITTSIIIIVQILIRLMLLVSASCNPYKKKVNVVEENAGMKEDDHDGALNC